MNATKHGLLAQGITELDDAEAYTALLERLNEAHQPAGDIETFLVERIALAMMRLRRIARMEAEFITGVLNPPPVPAGIISWNFYQSRRERFPGLPAMMELHTVEALAGTFQRYESAIENKLYRATNQLERLQWIRLGEQVSAPVTANVALHAEGHAVGSFGNS